MTAIYGNNPPPGDTVLEGGICARNHQGPESVVTSDGVRHDFSS